MHDAEHQDHALFVDSVVHHAIVADTESVERVAHPLDRLDGLAADATHPGCVARQLLKCSLYCVADVRWELLECPDCRWRELNGVRGQTSSFRLVVRPLA